MTFGEVAGAATGVVTGIDVCKVSRALSLPIFHICSVSTSQKRAEFIATN